ncbi:hypothetical protein V4Q76_02845 [Mycoplasmoides genitalium]|uniref:DUF240 domain-containing protein n=1 Tax=Mycoplasmoides genitalium TaxID=2097 RepID=UPI0000557DDF|nr:hypothetical protein [Mycoplasmoides genitalium]
MKAIKKSRFKIKTFLFVSFASTLTAGVLIVPSIYNGSAANLSQPSLRKSSTTNSRENSILLQQQTAITEQEENYIAKEKDYDKNFDLFQEKFKNEFYPRNFNVIDIFHLLSGFKSGIKKTVDLLNRL